MCDLLDVVYQPSRGYAYLLLVDPSDQSHIEIRAQRVLLFKVSNSPGDMEPTFVVDVNLRRWALPAGLYQLERAGYSWRDTELANPLYQIHVEGGTVIDIFSDKEFDVHVSR
jgi:hypothetical protein